MEDKWQVIVLVRRLFVKRPNSCLRNLVLRLLVQVRILWRSFLAPRCGLPDLGKGLDYTVVRHGEAASGDTDAAEQHCEKFKEIIEEGGFFHRRLTALKLAFSGRECHTQHISWRRRPPCLAISWWRTGLHCSFVPMLWVLQGQTTARVPFRETQNF